MIATEIEGLEAMQSRCVEGTATWQEYEHRLIRLRDSKAQLEVIEEKEKQK